MGLSASEALMFLFLHFIGMQLYLLFLRTFLVMHDATCNSEDCVFNNMTSIRAYTQAMLWPIYTLKWVAIAKGWWK